MAHNQDRRRVSRLSGRVHGIQVLQSRQQEAMLACEQHTCAADGVSESDGRSNHACPRTVKGGQLLTEIQGIPVQDAAYRRCGVLLRSLGRQRPDLRSHTALVTPHGRGSRHLRHVRTCL